MSSRRPALLLALLVAPLKLAARLLAGLEWLGRAVLGAIALAVGLAAALAASTNFLPLFMTDLPFVSTI